MELPDSIQSGAFFVRLKHNFATMGWFPYLFLWVLLFLQGLQSQGIYPSIREGNKAYLRGDYREAEAHYRKSLQANTSAEGCYNLGNSLYRQERFQEAAICFRKAAPLFSDADWAARAWYNLGNACFKQQQYADAVIAYENALKLQPGDTDAIRNLDIARRALKSQAASRPKPEIPPAINGSGGQGDTLVSGTQPPAKSQNFNRMVAPLNKSEAEQLLQIVEREELKVQQRLRQSSTPTAKSTKDW